MPAPLVTIAKFRDLPEALLAKGKVESAGIECFLQDDNMVRMDWLYSNMIGGMRLQVRPEDVAAAQEVLESPPPETIAQDDSGEVFDQPRCPRCHSLQISEIGLNRALTFGSWLLLGFPLRVRHIHWECDACGARWEEVEGKPAEPHG